MKNALGFVFLLSFCGIVHAQQQRDTIAYSLNARFNPGTGTYAPFLSTVNQYDRHSLTPNSLSVWATIQKKSLKTFDYGFGAELNANVSPIENRLFPGELYVEGKVGPFLAILGGKREIFGNQDPELSSGGLIGSQNSRPIPGLTFETDGWVDVPFTKGYLEFSGGMANGWFSDKTVTTNTLLHHKWLHGRVGGSFPITVNYGFHHVAQWGGNSPNNGESTVDVETFFRIFQAKGGSINGPSGEFYNVLGNHIVSQDLGLSLKTASLLVDVYWQNLNEDGPVVRMNKSYNKRDGLWGVSVRMPRFRPLHSLVAELLSTTDQSGPWHDLDGIIYGGMDGYYNNTVYENGYSFYGMTIGNPWLTSPNYNTDGGVNIQNNVVRLFYVSGLGAFNDFKYRFTSAYSLNWGLVQPTSTTPKKQFSGQLEVFHSLPFLRNTEASLGFSCDRGTKYGNNAAVLLGLRYTGQFMFNN